MPYQLFKQGEKYCVRNKDTGESKGCSTSRAKATARMRALYAASAGEKMGSKEIDEGTVDLFVKEAMDAFYAEYPDECADCDDKTKGLPDDKTKSYMGWTPATSYSELDAMETANEMREEASDLINYFPMLAGNILSDETITDKPKAIEELAKELSDKLQMISMEESDSAEKETKSPSAFERLVARVKEIFHPVQPETPDQEHPGWMIWKELDGSYRWLARYSNSFRDRDNPPEIIESISHKKFVDKVEKGLAPLPELWLWHRPEWNLGQADWVAHDDTVKGATFALAGGHISPQFAQVAEWLSTKEDALVSHGMPPLTIVRSETDPTHIIEHETREISVLPGWAAANVLTGFYIFETPTESNKEAPMPIPAEKREALINKWKMPESLLAQVEAANATTAEKAIDAGLESKDITTEEVQTEVAPVTEAVIAPVPEETPAQPPQDAATPPTREEIAEAIATVLNPLFAQVKELSEKVDGLMVEKEAKATAQADIIKEAVKNTPMASLHALLMQSVVGNPDTAIDGRSSLAKTHPKETKPVSSITGVPMLDRLIHPAQEQ